MFWDVVNPLFQLFLSSFFVVVFSSNLCCLKVTLFNEINFKEFRPPLELQKLIVAVSHFMHFKSLFKSAFKTHIYSRFLPVYIFNLSLYFIFSGCFLSIFLTRIHTQSGSSNFVFFAWQCANSAKWRGLPNSLYNRSLLLLLLSSNDLEMPFVFKIQLRHGALSLSMVEGNARSLSN